MQIINERNKCESLRRKGDKKEVETNKIPQACFIYFSF